MQKTRGCILYYMSKETVSRPMVSHSFTQGEEDPCTKSNRRKCENSTGCGRRCAKERAESWQATQLKLKLKLFHEIPIVFGSPKLAIISKVWGIISTAGAIVEIHKMIMYDSPNTRPDWELWILTLSSIKASPESICAVQISKVWLSPKCLFLWSPLCP